MNKTKIVSTPLGKIKVGPNTTPSTPATVKFSEMKSEFIKIAESGTIPANKLRDEADNYSRY